MQVPSEVQGVVAAAACAIFTNINLVLSKFMNGWDFPYLFLAGLAALCIAFALAMTMLWQGSWHLERREVKWVLLVGLFSSSANALHFLAVLAGANVGTVGALASLNTVIAALLGRLVLQEPLGKVHLLAVLLSVVGAVLISDPVEVMSGMGSNLLGNMLALSAGIAQSGILICARKSGGASSMMLSNSAMAHRCVVFWLLAALPAVPDGHLQSLAMSPPTSMLFFVGLTLLLLSANRLSMLASKKCPAALTSTVLTGVQMTTGYFLDFVLFHQVPKALTMMGAVLMFFSVVTMALTRLPHRTAADPTPVGQSLASFAAAEFAEREEVNERIGSTGIGPRQRASALPGILGKQTASA
ncbi:unnamed protein product [Durusdinium trenchii]|uniref:EamA domain-containing protein n=1 Tax=Durusdinium trenchii TaxID=1381693 RepID=A0ABP0QVD2_9DINO